MSALALQTVSSCCVLLCFKHISLALQEVSESCGISSLLRIPVLGTPVCEWLLCLVIFEAC